MLVFTLITIFMIDLNKPKNVDNILSSTDATWAVHLRRPACRHLERHRWKSQCHQDERVEVLRRLVNVNLSDYKQTNWIIKPHQLCAPNKNLHARLFNVSRSLKPKFGFAMNQFHRFVCTIHPLNISNGNLLNNRNRKLWRSGWSDCSIIT